MKYRLIRFSPNGEVEMDVQCVTPNQLGCNRDWIRSNPEGHAVLIKNGRKLPNGKIAEPSFYIINRDLDIDKPVKESYAVSVTTWITATEGFVMRQFKYLEMLKLTGAL